MGWAEIGNWQYRRLESMDWVLGALGLCVPWKCVLFAVSLREQYYAHSALRTYSVVVRQTEAG